MAPARRSDPRTSVHSPKGRVEVIMTGPSSRRWGMIANRRSAKVINSADEFAHYARRTRMHSFAVKSLG